MKKYLIFFVLFFVVFTLGACSSDQESTSQFAQDVASNDNEKIVNFETSYMKKNVSNKTRSGMQPIKLVGYVTIAYHGEDSVFVNKLWSYYKKEIDKAGSFLVLDGKVRVYFPLREAIVNTGNVTCYSDSLGNINKQFLSIDDNFAIKGRKRTSKNVFTKFAYSFKPEKKYADYKALVFDFGEKNLCCAMSLMGVKRMKTRAETCGGGVSCLQNHGGVNCTVAFSLNSGNCVIKYDRCMDYNGWGSDCSGSHLYFLGSDCSKAMAEGHCWNEVRY